MRNMGNAMVVANFLYGELAHDYLVLRQLLPNLNVIGGCCGTDHTHIEEICHHWHARVA